MEKQIRIALIKKDMTISQLAEKIGIKQQNLSNKLKRDNFTENDLKQIADALDCDLEISLIDKETKEKI